jgi:hypothetical protein
MRRATLLLALAAALSIAAPLAAAAGARESPVVLGGVVYGAPTGHGWGAPHPKFIYNGGDASGSISNVHWSDWGGTAAHGRGLHPTFKPGGGYYQCPVVAQLKAIDMGRCEGHRAYLRLLIREPRGPGRPLGRGTRGRVPRRSANRTDRQRAESRASVLHDRSGFWGWGVSD